MLLFFASVLTPGYLIIALILKKNISFLYKLAMSYGIGSFFITIQLFVWLFLFKLDFNLNIFYFIFFLENTFLIYLNRKNLNIFLKSKGFKLDFLKNLSLKEILLILLIAVQLIFLASNALVRPIAAYDSISMWAFKSKILFHEKQINFDSENDFLYLGGGGHRNYPWHVPLLQFWMHENLGEYNDLVANFIFVAYFICTIILLYFFLKNYLTRFNNFIFIFFLSSMPLFFYHGFNAYADLVLSYYILLFFGFFYQYLESKKFSYLALSAVFGGMALFVKNEAIIFVLAIGLTIALCFFLKKIKIKEILSYFSLMFALALPFFMFRFLHDLDISNVEPGIGFHPEIILNFLGGLFKSLSWNMWWFVLIIFALVNFKKIIKDQAMFLGWFFFLASIAGILMLYVFTEEYQFAINYTAIMRNILVIVPVSVFLVGVLFQEKNLR